MEWGEEIPTSGKRDPDWGEEIPTPGNCASVLGHKIPTWGWHVPNSGQVFPTQGRFASNHNHVNLMHKCLSTFLERTGLDSERPHHGGGDDSNNLENTSLFMTGDGSDGEII